MLKIARALFTKYYSEISEFHTPKIELFSLSLLIMHPR